MDCLSSKSIPRIVIPTIIEYYAIYYNLLVVHQHLLYNKSNYHIVLPTITEYHGLVLYQHLLYI